MNPSCKVEAVQTVCHIFTGICMDPVGHAEMFLCLILILLSLLYPAQTAANRGQIRKRIVMILRRFIAKNF